MATRLCHPPKVTEDPYGAISPPLYQTATFHQQSATECGPYDYSRSGNPTRDQLQAHVAELEVGHAWLQLHTMQFGCTTKILASHMPKHHRMSLCCMVLGGPGNHAQPAALEPRNVSEAWYL